MSAKKITPQGLKNAETAMRNVIKQHITGDSLREYLASATQQMQEKQELVNELRRMLVALDTADFLANGDLAFKYGHTRPKFRGGAGPISTVEYRAMLAEALLDFERFEGVVAVLQPLFDAEQKGE